MNARYLFEVAVRVLGVWTCVAGLLNVNEIALHVRGPEPMDTFEEELASTYYHGATVLIPVVLGALLIWLAPAFSRWFGVPHDGVEHRASRALLLRSGIGVVGVWVLFRTSQLAASLLFSSVFGFAAPHGLPGVAYDSGFSVIKCLSLCALGLALLRWSDPLTRWIDGIR